MMTKKAFGFVGLLALSAWQTSARAEPGMAAQYQGNLSMSDCQAVQRAADFLSEAQVRTDGRALGWSWRVADGQVAPNLAGLISLALLDAHAANGHPGALRAAWRYAEGVMEELAGNRTPFKADVELLFRLGELTGDRVYQDAARELWRRLLARSPDGAREIARIARGRSGVPALLGFDAALGIRAALALGERAYAFQLADETLRRSASWYLPVKDPRFSLVSAAALTPALASLDEAHYRDAIRRFRADLTRAQAPSGAFWQNETQPSAYAVLALLDSPRAEERAAAERGLVWLRSTMLRDGSFAAFNDHMPEPFVGEVLSAVNAEVLAALSRACAQRSPR
jgi:hypothetical protein